MSGMTLDSIQTVEEMHLQSLQNAERLGDALEALSDELTRVQQAHQDLYELLFF